MTTLHDALVESILMAIGDALNDKEPEGWRWLAERIAAHIGSDLVPE